MDSSDVTQLGLGVGFHFLQFRRPLRHQSLQIAF
jgi:hypothetical protein